MNLDDFIIICSCVIDEMMPMVLKDQRLRTRGYAPKQNIPYKYHYMIYFSEMEGRN